MAGFPAADAFNVADQHRLMVDYNHFFNHVGEPTSEDPLWDPNSIAIESMYGSNIDATGNQFSAYELDIVRDAVQPTNAFLCSNDMEQADVCQIRGLGIVDQGVNFATTHTFAKLNTSYKLDTAYVAKNFTASTLIENKFNHGNVGAKFQDQCATVLYGSHTGSDIPGYAGFNHFENNSVAVVLRDDGIFNAQPMFGRLCGNHIDAGVYGENTFATSGGLYFRCENPPTGANYPLLNALSENHWSPGIPTLAYCVIPALTTPFDRVLYANVSDGSASDPDFSCGGGFIAGKSKSAPQGLLFSTNPCDPSDTDYLFFEAMAWDGIDDQKALDTMRLFVERFPNYWIQNENVLAIEHTVGFAASVAQKDTFYVVQDWIDEYNWLASVYSANTDTSLWGRRFRSTVLVAMASSETYFDRNRAANLFWNAEQLFPNIKSSCDDAINQIRTHQKQIPEDTTAWHKIQIPPLPYGAFAVPGTSVPSVVSLSVVPNPADKSLAAFVESPFAAPATLAIYDALGREVQRLPESRLQMGHNRLDFDCTSLPAGSYYLRLSTGGTVKTLRITIEH